MFRSITDYLYQSFNEKANKIPIKTKIINTINGDISLPKYQTIDHINKNGMDTIETFVVELNKKLNQSTDLTYIINNPDWLINVYLDSDDSAYACLYPSNPSMNINWTTKELTNMHPRFNINSFNCVIVDITHSKYGDKINPFSSKEEQEKILKELKEIEQHKLKFDQFLKQL